MGNFEDELRHLINCHSLENASDTPDFVLAAYLLSCLENYNRTLQARERWYGRSIRYPEGLPPPPAGS